MRRESAGEGRRQDRARRPRAASAALVILTAGLCVSAVDAAPAAMPPGGMAAAPPHAEQSMPPDPSAALDRVIEAYVARVRGSDRGGERAAPTAESFRRAIEADRALLERVRAVDPGDLSRAAQVDRLLLIGILESEVRVAEARRPWENDPALYVPAGEIGAAVDGLRAGQARAGERLAVALARLPRSLELGRANLRRPPRRFTEAAIFQTEQTLASLRQLPPTAGAELAAAASSAGDELERYLQFLRGDVLPRSDGSWAIGRQLYDFVLARRWFLEDDAEAILARGRRAFEETEAEAQRVAERMRPGAHWVDVYEGLKDDHPPADGIKAAYQEQMDAARAFVHTFDVVTLPEAERVVTVDTPPALRRSSPFGTFQTVDPFGEDLVGRLVLTPVEDWLSEEQRRERLRSHHTAWIPIIAVHEAYPGHHAQAIKARQNPRILRRVVNESIYSEGWGLFTEQLMFELGFLEGDDIRLTMLRNRLWRAARVILDVSLHTGRMTFEEAVDFMVERVRFERYAAELEVAMYPRRPTYVLGYLIGMQEIAAIRDVWVATHGEPDPPAELWDAFLSTGSIPPALVRAELLGEPLPQR